MPVFGTSSSLSASGYGFGRSLQSFEISPSTTYVNEGSSVTFTIEAVGVGNGTVLGWNITGSVNASDFVSGSTSGTTTVSNEQATITLTLANDATTEGQESFQVNVTRPDGELAVQSEMIFVSDTSIIPAYIGTYLFKSPRHFKGTGADWTIPSGTTHIYVRTSGSGSTGSITNNSYTDGPGGAGGYSKGLMAVSSGQVYKVAVGTIQNNGSRPSNGHSGGFSGILSGPTSPTAPEPAFTSYILAGGGGTGQPNLNYAHSYSTGRGGAGGGNSGQPGDYVTNKPGSFPAGGGSQSSGGKGAGPVPQSHNYAGSYLKGGNGGGGGGYYGGGGAPGLKGGAAGGSGTTVNTTYNPSPQFQRNTYTGNRQSVSPAMFTPDYYLLGPNPISPSPWGAGGSGYNGPYTTYSANLNRGNGFVIIHCFRRSPVTGDMPSTFTILGTY